MKKSIRFTALLAITLLIMCANACTNDPVDTGSNEVSDSVSLPSENPPAIPSEKSQDFPSDFPSKIINEVAILVNMDFREMPYSEQISNDYALEFIYHLAMRSYYDRAKAYDGAGFDATTQYVVFSKDELAGILDLTFGERFLLSDLKPESADFEWVLYDAGTEAYYVSIGETLPVEIEFLESTADGIAVFTYTLDTSMTKASGEVTVTVVPSEKNASMVSIASIDVNEKSRVSEDD